MLQSVHDGERVDGVRVVVVGSEGEAQGNEPDEDVDCCVDPQHVHKDREDYGPDRGVVSS